MWAFVWAVAIALVPPSAWAADAEHEAHIHLRGTARIDAHTARAAGKLLLSGVVVDDVARPMAGGHVALVVSRAATGASGASDPVPGVALANAAPAACSDGAAPPITERADTLVLVGDEAGRFCVRLSLPTDRYVAHLEARAQGLVDGAKLDLPIDLSLAPLTLRFDPEPGVIMLDDESAIFEVVASTEDDGVTVAAAGLGLELSREGSAPLASAITNASGRVRFGVESGRLGPPGRGELRVSFAGSSGAGATTRVAAVERHTWVELTTPDASEGRLPAGSPEDGIPLRVVATAGCARRGCKGTPTGTIEARVGSNVVGVAALQSREGRSEAHLVATFPMPGSDVETVTLRYIPDAPWFRPRGELTMSQPLRSPSPWRKAPLVLAALGVLAWLVLARFSPRDRSTAPRTRPSRAPLPEPSIALVAAGRSEEGWKGRLRDAHDGGPVAGARVAVERRGFERVETVVQAWSDADGSFHLPALPAPPSQVPGDEIVAEGQLHASLRRPLPPAGELDIALILRKRALLERLVAWARGRGAPFDARPEATPGHVRRAAGSEFTVARWADAVERAAYGGQNVDAAAQAEVDRLAPADPAPHTEPQPDPHPRSPEHVDGARRRSL